MIARLYLILLLMMQLTMLPANAASPSDNSATKVDIDKFVADLTDQHGAPLTKARLYGKPAVVHFGFTHCPVVCPTMLNEVALLMERLGAEG